uniref:Uncharacterized protein n=1 Tax=Anguilla anguilla TaxID=7936 RepID=A0A0E9STC1_ANGAN
MIKSNTNKKCSQVDSSLVTHQVIEMSRTSIG